MAKKAGKAFGKSGGGKNNLVKNGPIASPTNTKMLGSKKA